MKMVSIRMKLKWNQMPTRPMDSVIKEIQTVARKYEPPQDWHLKVFNFYRKFS